MSCRAGGRGRPGDELGDRGGRNEAPAANDDAGELSRPEETVDGVPRDATESGFLDRVESAVLHRGLNGVRGSRTVCYLAIRAVMTVDTAAWTTLRVLQVKGKRE